MRIHEVDKRAEELPDAESGLTTER